MARCDAHPGRSARPVSPETRAAFADVGWTARAVALDVFVWLEREDHPQYDAVMANLFMHHFEGDALSRLFRGIARITDCFIACEPRRARVALLRKPPRRRPWRQRGDTPRRRPERARGIS